MNRKGVALVLSGPSGAGKSTLCKMFRKKYPNLEYSVSCTTRFPRPGEINGQDYFFVTGEEFGKMREAGGFAEWAEVHGNFYGTPLAPIQTLLQAGRDILLDIDVQGAAQLKTSLPDAVFVFLLPPTLQELAKRLSSRGEDDAASQKLRLDNAVMELREAFWYDYLIVNETLESAQAQFSTLYEAACMAACRNAALLEKLLAEVNHA